MKIRPAIGTDIPELTNMYNELLMIAYPKREIAPIEILYGVVIKWFANNNHITIAYDNDNIVGFTLITFNNAGGVTETVLDAEISYIYPEFRKTRAAYLLYNEGIKFATFMGMALMSTSNPDSAPIIKKRYGAELSFSHFEISKEYINNLEN